MEEIWKFISSNYKWIFSGIGVFIVGIIISLLRKKRKKFSGDIIITHGKQSPGIVGGNYEVNINEKRKNKH